MRYFVTAAGAHIPALGMGTWNIGERPRRHAEEIRALQTGIDLGLTLVDTAEMYGEGRAEELVGEAIRGRREAVFLVTKVLPSNATRAGTAAAAERSLERLGVETIDLYLLHWPGPHPLEETLGAFERLVEQGKVRHYGVSNFDTEQMRTAVAISAGARVACNQVLYNLQRREIEWSLVPFCAERAIAVMAYTPLASGSLTANRKLQTIARRRGATPSQVALAWTLRDPRLCAIFKAADAGHVRENAAALKFDLDAEELDELDRAFPPPDREQPLGML